MKKVNAYIYQLIYALNKLTSKWLKNVNDRAKTEGLDIFTCNDDKNIFIETRKAPDKFAPEDQAKIDEYKATFKPINEGEKVLAIKVEHITKSTQDKVDCILNMLENNQDSKVIAKVASLIAINNKK